MARPVLSASVAAFAAFFGWVATNALQAQVGRHAHPLLTTRPVDGAPRSAAGDEAPGTGMPVPLVMEVQTALAQAGYYAAAIDGRPGKATSAAIRGFQSERGLRVDGEATPRLLAVLRREREAALAPTPEAVERRMASLDPAETGTASDAGASDATATQAPARDLVRRVQEGLSAARIADLRPDGIVGARTEAAIRSFQAAQGLPVTGVPDETLVARLEAIGAGRR